MTEWRTGKGKGLKRPPHSVVTQAEPKGQSENPVGSFWTTMAEEDEQRLFTEKVNKTISECLNLINEVVFFVCFFAFNVYGCFVCIYEIGRAHV